MLRRASGEELLTGILQARIERWLEQERVFHVVGFGDVALAGELDWEPGVGPVYLRRLADGQLWRADITITARLAESGRGPARTGGKPRKSSGRRQPPGANRRKLRSS